MKPESPASEAPELVACTSCFAENRRFEAFCQTCGAPIGTTATLSHVQVIETEGFVTRKALEGRPKLIVLVGLWLTYFPVLVLIIGCSTYIVLNYRGILGFFSFWALIALAIYASIVLYRVTKNYLTTPKR